MKREIVCVKHEPKPAFVSADTDPLALAESYASGESTRVVRGKLLRSSVCDVCGERLELGGAASAVSFYSDRAPYFEWEDEYVTPKAGR